MNTLTGKYVQIVADSGGRIEDLPLGKSNEELRSVLLTHHNNEAAIIITMKQLSGKMPCGKML